MTLEDAITGGHISPGGSRVTIEGPAIAESPEQTVVVRKEEHDWVAQMGGAPPVPASELFQREVVSIDP